MRRDINTIADRITENTDVKGLISDYLIEECKKSDAFLFQFLLEEEIFLKKQGGSEDVLVLIEQQVYDLFNLFYRKEKEQPVFTGFESAKGKVLEWVG